jgi:hypothetical protein
MNRKDTRRGWSTKDLATEAGVTQGRIRQLLLKGEIDGYKVSRDWIIPDAEAKNWLRNRGVRAK